MAGSIVGIQDSMLWTEIAYHRSCEELLKVKGRSISPVRKPVLHFHAVQFTHTSLKPIPLPMNSPTPPQFTIEESLLNNPAFSIAIVVGVRTKDAEGVSRAYIVRDAGAMHLKTDDVHSCIGLEMSDYHKLRGGLRFIEREDLP